MKTTIRAPDDTLASLSLVSAARFRRGEFGKKVRKHHRDAVFLLPEGGHPWPYRIDVWGDPAGRVTVHAHRAPEGVSA